MTVLVSAIEAMSPWEVVAVVFGVAYLLLAAKENILCWYAALISTLVSIYVFWNVSLLMESALQVYYVLMAIYGWYQWKYGSRDDTPIPISCWSAPRHLSVIGVVILVSALSGYLLDQHTGAARPYLDSFTTWGSVVTTYMVAKKVLENWLYWLVIDSVSAFLYIDRGLYLYALLFIAYLVIVVCGYFSWKKILREEQAHSLLQTA